MQPAKANLTIVDDGRKLSIPAGPKVSTQRLECDHFGRLGIDPEAGR